MHVYAPYIGELPTLPGILERMTVSPYATAIPPQDASFQQSREQVTAWLQAIPYKDGIISPES